ncbi:Lnb N-terminal periplasmic domain-containing protein [Massilia oculi]|uniref:Lnb N-terminal periplasmic domain-containing protein n=1 Tax=Massilia oculi TaxID=945844 RepID=UPI001AAFE3EF
MNWKRIARSLSALPVVAVTTWGALALWFQLAPALALAIGGAWALLGLAAALVLARAPGWRHERRLLLAGALAALAMLGWWQSLAPSHARPWADDVARLLESTVDGDRLELRNVRAFEWRTETDYTPRWETRRYDLSRLESADLVLSYWMGPHIAHTLVSFGFSDGQRLVFSLEIRKERDEEFSAIGGFFRKFEQVIVASDERDLIRTRSNVRGEQVYLYRLRATPAQLRSVLLDYLARAERLRRQPEFYNTLTSNCTTILFELARQIDPALPLDYRLLASGHFAEYAYDQGALTSRLPYAVLRDRGHINARAIASDADAHDFSQAIRAGVPGIAAPAASTVSDQLLKINRP